MKDYIIESNVPLKCIIPNSEDKWIQINYKCEFRACQNGYILWITYYLHARLYSINELDKCFNIVCTYTSVFYLKIDY